MGGGQVCLKWNSFHSSLTSGFKTLWEENGLVDVTLASDGQCIQAHKLILSACSPFFREVFKSNPCQHPVIILQDTHFSELESLLCFVYKGEVNIDEENLPALLRAAETLQIRGLAGASEQVQNELGSITSEIEEVPVDESSPPSKRSKESPPSKPWQPHYSRTKKRSGSRNSARNAPISVETVLETTLAHSPDRVPKLEPMDHDLEIDGDATPSLLDAVDEDSNTALFLGPVMEMKISHDRVSASDTGQSNDGPFFSAEKNLQSLELNQVFNCLKAPKKDNLLLPFPCPFCERTYTSWGFRRRHIKAMHTHSERLSCKWCLLVMETHADWQKHVSAVHGLSPGDAQNGILILEEANMVLRIPNPPRLDTLVTMIRESSSCQSSPACKEQDEGPETRVERIHCDSKFLETASAAEDLSQRKAQEVEGQEPSKDSEEDDAIIGIKVERPDTPD
ncbi:protein tramtrack, beta isoform-like isoform X2 [Thrips palmi]|nr:protein tramtrack, beta isoform-like isoform X2 [Thrips palmi]